MDPLTRKSFIRSLTVAGIGSAFLPKIVKGHVLFDPVNVPAIAPMSGPSAFGPNRLAIVDLHCHPSLKMFLWGRHLWRHHSPGPGTNPIALQDDINELSSGQIEGQDGVGFVKGLVVAHYLVEASAESQWDLLKKFYPLIKRLFSRIANRLEHEDWSNFTQINQMIDELEGQVHLANQKQTKLQFVIARNYKEFESAIQEKKFPVAHAIEGAHALGRNFAISQGRTKEHKPEPGTMKKSISDASPDAAAAYIRNLQALKDRGVCMLTLAHLFQNDLAFCVEGISPDQKKSIGMTWTYDNNNPTQNRPLTPVGRAVAIKMLEIGMIIDLTHSTPAAREEIFQLNRDRLTIGKKMRPLVFTHTGAQEIFHKYDQDKDGKDRFPGFKFYGISEKEIKSICECHGTVGVIPEVFWLTGGDTHLKKYGFDPKMFRNGITFMVETIQYFNSKTIKKDYSNITIGTDFDGFADAPNDLYKASQLGKLIKSLQDAGLSTLQVEQITSGNALRVLENGWD